jgi:hypothetical protein
MVAWTISGQPEYRFMVCPSLAEIESSGAGTCANKLTGKRSNRSKNVRFISVVRYWGVLVVHAHPLLA